MTEAPERRTALRITLRDRPAAWVRGLRAVRLLDLSRTGAQIEHLDLFRFGASCAIELSPPCGTLSLPAQVVWCAVIGRKRTLGGESHLVVRSGLRFTTLTGAQFATLADSLERLAALPHPIGDSQRRSA